MKWGKESELVVIETCQVVLEVKNPPATVA